MKERCYNPNIWNFCNYGGRGIIVFEGWKDNFKAFLHYIGKAPTPKHSLDRIDNSKNYEPGNVKWSTVHEQARNKRSNINITFNNETKTLREWARSLNMNPNNLKKRIYIAKWPLEIALTQKKRHY